MASDVVVVGGGVVGVCAAYELAQAGLGVTLVEQGEIASGSSYGNAGLIVPSHSAPLAQPGALRQGLGWLLDAESPFYVKPRPSWELVRWLWRFRGACTAAHVTRALPVLRDLSLASLARYRELARLEGLDSGFREDGLMTVYRTAAGYRAGREEAHHLQAHGLAAEVLDPAAARALEPCLAADVVGAVRFPTDAHLTPHAFVRGLAAQAERDGITIRRATQVLGFRTAGRRVVEVETTRGTLAADQVVLAAGAWSPPLGRELGLRLPVQAAKGYSVTYQRPAAGPQRPLLLGEARVAVTPMGNWLRLAGTLELAGLDLGINRRRVGALQRAAGRYLELGETPRLVELWGGLRPCTPDGLQILGRPARYDNLILATGHAMIGISLGPVTGQLVAQLARGVPPAIDLLPLSPNRFG